jgi:hypothetical protein
MRDDLYTMDLNATGQNAACRVQYRSELMVGTVVNSSARTSKTQGGASTNPPQRREAGSL